MMSSQFSWTAPILACFATLLWIQIFRAAGLKVFKSWLFWFFVLFLILIGAQIFNSVSMMELRVEDLQSWVPYTLKWDIAGMVWINWYAIAGLFTAMELEEIRLNRKEIENFVIISAVMLAVLGVVQFYCKASSFYWSIPYDIHHPFFSVFPYINNSATFFMLAGGLALSRGWRYLPVFILFAFCSWLVSCRFIIGCFGLILLYKMMKEKNVWFIGILAVVVFFFKADEIIAGRWHEYVINYEIILHRPFFGAGISGGSYVLENYIASVPVYITQLLSGQPNTHCDILVFTVEYGLVGLIILACIVFRVVVRKTTGVTCAVLAAILAIAHSFIDMPMRNAVVVAVLGMIIMFRRSTWEN